MKKQFITPALAKEWLKKANKYNRIPSPDRVNFYAHRMKNGTFSLIENEPDSQNVIAFDTRGVLLNGHTRLNACIVAGVGFWAWVREGASPKEFIRLDTRESIAVRDLSDLVVIQSRMSNKPVPKNLKPCVQAVKIIHHYDEGVFRGGGHGAAQRPGGGGDTMRRGKSLLDAYLQTWIKHEAEIQRCVKLCQPVRAVMSVGMAAALMWGFSRRDKPLAEEFFARMADGVDLGSRHPIRLLRQRLLVSRADRARRLDPHQVVECAVKVWGLLRDGQTSIARLPSLGGQYPVVK
jgi:hypothetical protein